MVETVDDTDMGIGLAMVFTVVAVVAAAGMAVTVEQQVVAAGLFAAAMVTGTVAVAAPHLYGTR